MNNTNTPAEGDLRNYTKIEPVKSRLPRKKNNRRSGGNLTVQLTGFWGSEKISRSLMLLQLQLMMFSN